MKMYYNLIKILVMSHFLVIKMDVLSVFVNNINLVDTSFEKDDPYTIIIIIRFLA